MRIIVENTVCLNSGDAAILLAIRHILTRVYGPDTRFVVFDSQPDVAARLYPRSHYPDLEFRKLLSESIFKYPYRHRPAKNALKAVYNRLRFGALARYGRSRMLDRAIYGEADRQSLDCYRNADLVITTGGTYLVENYNLERRINQFAIDSLAGKDPVFFTQSLGPFEKPFNRRKLKPVFDRSALILLRDQRSLEHIQDLVEDSSKCHVVADAVFALADTGRIEAILSGAVPAPSGRVAISVRHWNYVEGGEEGMRRYVNSLRAMVTALVREYGKAVTFVSTCQGVPEYAHDDSKTARAVVAELDPDVASRVEVDAEFHTPEQIMALAAGFDFVISTRMHMMIMALCVGTPVLPIAYEFKTRELSKRIGVDDVLLDIDTMQAEEALAKLASFTANADRYRDRSLGAVLAEYRSAMSAGDLVKAAVPGSLSNASKDVAHAMHQRVA